MTDVTLGDILQESTVEKLGDADIYTVKDVLEHDVKFLTQIDGIGPKTAIEIWDKASKKHKKTQDKNDLEKEEQNDGMQKLSEIQRSVDVPKDRYNDYGEFSYRSLEDILEEVKNHMDSSCNLLMSEELEVVGDRYYVKCNAAFFWNGDRVAQVTAHAREEKSRKGMDGSQITGSATSYARKYALGGLFAIAENNDPDTMPTDDSQETESASDEDTKDFKKKAAIFSKLRDLEGDIDRSNVKQKVKDLTDLELTEENYDEIYSRLETLSNEREQGENGETDGGGGNTSNEEKSSAEAKLDNMQQNTDSNDNQES